jgi:hypothetical protein
MATTYTLISSNVLSSSAASVTFSSIPATYTDLVLRFSSRDTGAGTISDVWLRFNSSSSSYSYTVLYGTGSSAGSFRGSAAAQSLLNYGDGSGATANTFSSGEVYIPNYAGSANKVHSVIHAQEDNATAARINAGANLWSNSSAITELTILPESSRSFVAGSSFYLYGISNA